MKFKYWRCISCKKIAPFEIWLKYRKCWSCGEDMKIAEEERE